MDEACVAMLAGSVTPWIPVAIFAAAIDRLFVATEERMLLETFGEAFTQHRQRVRRWI